MFSLAGIFASFSLRPLYADGYRNFTQYLEVLSVIEASNQLRYLQILERLPMHIWFQFKNIPDGIPFGAVLFSFGAGLVPIFSWALC